MDNPSVSCHLLVIFVYMCTVCVKTCKAFRKLNRKYQPNWNEHKRTECFYYYFVLTAQWKKLKLVYMYVHVHVYCMYINWFLWNDLVTEILPKVYLDCLCTSRTHIMQHKVCTLSVFTRIFANPRPLAVRMHLGSEFRAFCHIQTFPVISWYLHVCRLNEMFVLKSFLYTNQKCFHLIHLLPKYLFLCFGTPFWTIEFDFLLEKQGFPLPFCLKMNYRRLRKPS